MEKEGLYVTVGEKETEREREMKWTRLGYELWYNKLVMRMRSSR